jgi:hypothetical protein
MKRIFKLMSLQIVTVSLRFHVKLKISEKDSITIFLASHDINFMF